MMKELTTSRAGAPVSVRQEVGFLKRIRTGRLTKREFGILLCLPASL